MIVQNGLHLLFLWRLRIAVSMSPSSLFALAHKVQNHGYYWNHESCHLDSIQVVSVKVDRGHQSRHFPSKSNDTARQCTKLGNGNEYEDLPKCLYCGWEDKEVSGMRKEKRIQWSTPLPVNARDEANLPHRTRQTQGNQGGTHILTHVEKYVHLVQDQ